MSNLSNAQNSPNIIGAYNLGSSSPEGGSHLIVLESGDYAIAYFGGVQTGKWNISEGNNFIFTPNNKESKFEIFGRHNKDLKGETKIYFNSFENSQTFIQLKKEEEKEELTMQRVFNKGANCFSYPYISTFKTIANSISFTYIKYGDTNRTISTFENPDGFNDFIANFIEVEKFSARPFFASLKNNHLYFEDETISKRTPINKDSEDIQFIKKIIDTELNQDTLYLNPSYNVFDIFDGDKGQKLLDNSYVYNEQKNAFIIPKYYVEGSEYNSEKSFEDMSIIYFYSNLKMHQKNADTYKINEKSLFEVNCD